MDDLVQAAVNGYATSDEELDETWTEIWDSSNDLTWNEVRGYTSTVYLEIKWQLQQM